MLLVVDERWGSEDCAMFGYRTDDHEDEDEDEDGYPDNRYCMYRCLFILSALASWYQAYEHDFPSPTPVPLVHHSRIFVRENA